MSKNLIASPHAVVALLGATLICGNVAAQTWVVADTALWYWDNGETLWSPDEETLSEALGSLTEAFRTAAEKAAPRQVPEWTTYSLEYQGRIAADARVIRIAGDCALERRTAPGADERIIVTGGGGTCLFWATYDVASKDVTEFNFGSPY